MKTTEEDIVVMGAGKEFMVLATTVKKEDVLGTFIINHVPNYPLGCTIPCTQNILLFFFNQTDIKTKNFLTKMANVKSAKKIVIWNTVIVVHGAILTFTSDVLSHRFPWNLKSTTTH